MNERNTLSLNGRPGSYQSRPQTHDKREQRQSKPPKQNRERKLDMHEEILKAHKESGKAIWIKADDIKQQVKVVDFDKYSILVEDPASGDKAVVFKSAISAFEA